MQLVVAEKPSVARDLAKVLGARTRDAGCIRGDGIVLSWARGHLAELEEPAHYDAAWKRWSFDTLPMLPDQFALRVRPDARDQWTKLRALLRDKQFTEVINACDAGREGELIFRYVYELAGCRLPIRRLWVASMTDAALRAAWADLRPSARYDALADAARCRSEADWLVGLNATRAMTCLARKGGGSQLLSVGRVQTPTLAMIVDRDEQIAAFVPEDFWRVEATLTPEGGGESWTAVFTRKAPNAPTERDKDKAAAAERFSTAEDAELLRTAVADQQGTVAHAQRREKLEPPPLLYDLTSLQRRANQRFGLSAARTLELAQALYERHKLLTYPRTDSKHLTPEQAETLPMVLRGLSSVPPYKPFCEKLLAGPPLRPGKRVVDAAEVGDHHAILPTGKDPMGAQLSIDEKRVFDLVSRRVIAALMPPARFDMTVLIVAVDPLAGAPLPADAPPPLHFHARGRVCRDPGWRAVDPPGSHAGGKDRLLPPVDVGQPVQLTNPESLPGQTRPPRPHNDASILQSMETAGRQLDDAELKRALRSSGLGTPATRAAVLQTLINRGFVRRQARDLRATDRGTDLIHAVPVDELKSASLTGRWEARLADIAEGRDQRDRFMRDVRANTATIVAAISRADPPPPELRDDDTVSLGDCPICGKPVRDRKAVYSCDTGRACSFVIWGTMSKRKISVSAAKKLLKTGRAGPYKGFKSKTGKPFEASLVLGEDGKVAFEFGDRPSAPTAAKPKPKTASTTPDPTGQPCPSCGAGALIRGRQAWGCDQWRSGCRFTIPFEIEGSAITAAELTRRLAGPTN